VGHFGFHFQAEPVQVPGHFLGSLNSRLESSGFW
jgi:hypothetical protein